ncbi:hypothetical protein FZO89_09475 [Luteimonas viscosa]|uniref:Uncharacterized protein n=1 Tax=Luteimonas viscosa TaxID=1132694 RepID=A0A5D4XP63_9GAMM|nr:hypothetical protein [Luteimonas viscosa]TYT26467.1 hypothetical protein FZO89_09475 [Luteimonas viscosa]
MTPTRDNGGYDSGDAKTGQREQVAEAKQAFGLRQRRLVRPVKEEGRGKCHSGTGCKQRRCFGDLHQAYETEPGNQVVPDTRINPVTKNERCQQQGEPSPKSHEAIYPPRQCAHEP